MRELLHRDMIKLLMLEIHLRQLQVEERPMEHEGNFQQKKPIKEEKSF